MKKLFVLAFLSLFVACRQQPPGPIIPAMDRHTALSQINQIASDAQFNCLALRAIQMYAFDANHNYKAFVDLARLGSTVGYNTDVLVEIAKIASQTDYECKYFEEIAPLAVRHTRNSNDVIALAMQVRDARTGGDFAYLEHAIRLLDERCELKSVDEAVRYTQEQLAKE